MRNKPDFVSAYFYCTTGASFDERIDNLADRIRLLRDSLARAGLDELKLILSEWNTEIMDNYAYNDSTRKAVDLLKLISGNLGSVEMGCYQRLGDLSKEPNREALFDGGLGLLTKDGIKKPSYFAYQFLCTLGDELIEHGENYIVTRLDRTLQILAWRGEPSSPDTDESTQLELTLEHIPNGTYLERRQQSGNSVEQYQSCMATLGDHPELHNKAVFRYLAHPDISVSARICTRNRLTVTVACRQNQFCFLELIPV